MSMMFCVMLSAVAASEPPSISTNTSARQSVQRRRKTGIGAMLGYSSSGLSIRHQWSARFASQLSLYSTLGGRLGIYSLGTQLQFVMNRHQVFRFYMTAPVKWTYKRRPSEHEANFGPDPGVHHEHRLQYGVGLGLEVFLGPQVALVFELPVVHWTYWERGGSRTSQPLQDFWMIAPNTGIHVYFQ